MIVSETIMRAVLMGCETLKNHPEPHYMGKHIGLGVEGMIVP